MNAVGYGQQILSPSSIPDTINAATPIIDAVDTSFPAHAVYGKQMYHDFQPAYKPIARPPFNKWNGRYSPETLLNRLAGRCRRFTVIPLEQFTRYSTPWTAIYTTFPRYSVATIFQTQNQTGVYGRLQADPPTKQRVAHTSHTAQVPDTSRTRPHEFTVREILKTQTMGNTMGN